MSYLKGVQLANQLGFRRAAGMSEGQRAHLYTNEQMAQEFIQAVREESLVHEGLLSDTETTMFFTEHAVVINHPNRSRAIMNRHTGHLILHHPSMKNGVINDF